MTVIAISPNIGPIRFDAVISENHTSEIEITANPIETGSEVNDHAYIKPKQVIIDVADNNAAIVFNLLTAFQKTRIPFLMITGLTIYRSMLIQSINAKRDRSNSRILRATIVLREVIIVSTGTAPAGSQRPSGASGGANAPSRATATNSATADRVGGTVIKGDMPTTTVPPSQQQSILSGILG